MPRGVYDRSKMKKPGITTAAPTKAPVKAGKPGRKPKALAVSENLNKAMEAIATSETASKYASPIYSVQPLYQHMASLTEARKSIAEQQASHNAALIGAIDTELAQTVKSLTAWREGNFPIEFIKPASKIVAEEPTKAPAVPPAPVLPVAPVATPVQATGTPVPPLPFTPQTAHEVVKQAQG